MSAKNNKKSSAKSKSPVVENVETTSPEMENNPAQNVEILPPLVDDVQPEVVMNLVEETGEEILTSNSFDEVSAEVTEASPVEVVDDSGFFVGTIKDLADKYKTEPVTIYGLVRFLEMTEQVQIVGTKKVEGQRGRKSNIYKIARSLTINLL